MTTRKSASKRTARKGAARKARARKAPARRKTARKQAKRKGPPKRKAKTKAKPRTSTPESIARKIVRVTKVPGKLSIPDLYAPDCVSYEAGGGEPARGHAGIQQKQDMWEGMQDSSKAKWNARNVLVKGNTICIEWEADVQMRDGRRLKLEEVAVHQLKGGKIASERYYYDPSRLNPPAAAHRPAAPAPPRRAAAASPSPGSVSSYGVGSLSSPEDPDDDDEDFSPKVDPIDL